MIRTTAIIFIILANILLLSHAVVPHHHHNKQVCLLESHCLSDNNSTGQSTDKDSHNHDGEDNSNDCILKEFIAVTYDWKQELKPTPSNHDQHGIDSFKYCLLNIAEESFSATSPHFNSGNYTNSSYTVYVSTSLGLRAPPTA